MVSVLCVPALKATQAAGNNRNPPLKTFRTGLLPAGYGFSVQCKCFCWTCAGSPQVAPCERSSPAFLFCAILIFIDLTKKLVGGILKEMEMPEHWVISTRFGK